MNRKILINKLKQDSSKKWDVVVIGGGATGLGVAVDAVSRGYTTLLLEQSDFAQSTSSRSTKLMHGGVRYLAQGDVMLVMEALHERSRMHINASHITFNQEFVIPIYTRWDALLYTVGLKFYDILAGRLSMGKSHFISRKKTINRLPLIQTKKLKGGVVYHDGQFDDSRFALTLAQTCEDKGGIPLNYFKVTELLKNKEGKVNGVKTTDLESGEVYDISAKVVINASGVFADDILKMDSPSAKSTIRPSQGVHIVLPNSFLKSNSAIMIPKTDDGRVLFAIPWYDKVVVGTTDTPINHVDIEPKALDEEIEFILETASRFLTHPPKKNDILSVYAGLRPLAADPDNPSSTKEISRRHKITVSSSGLISIIGGKWTIYRRMAEDTINKAIKVKGLKNSLCKTKNMPLYGSPKKPLNNRLHIYGKHAEDIKKMIIEQPDLGQILHPAFPYTKAEIVWICRNEMPLKLEDIISRRTRALLLDAKASAELAPLVAKIMAKEYGYGNEWIEEEVKAISHLLSYYTTK
jgi:glycerol-3-phosphate dehydrogenase